MVTIATRIAKLEAKHGSDMDRWVNSLSDQQLEARISDLTVRIRASLTASGVDCSGLSDEEVCELAALHDGDTA